MRTTITLDPDVEALVRRAMRERGLTFKQAVNEAIRLGMSPAVAGAAQSQFPTYDMGEPLVDITIALRLAGELEAEELAHELTWGE